MNAPGSSSTARRVVPRVVAVSLLAGVISLMLGGIGSTASPWNVDIVSASRVASTVTIAGTAYSPAGQASGNYLEISWGDGTTQTLPNFSGQGPWAWGPVSHTYAADGSYTITAALLHASPNGNDRNATDTVVVVIPDPGGDDEVDVQVALGECVTDGTTSSTPVSVSITGDGSATVVVRDASDEIVATFTASGSDDLAPGSYTYSVTAAEGSVLSEGSDTGGPLTVEDCTPIVGSQGSVSVSAGACDYVDGASVTPIDITIAPEGAATVVVSRGADVVATFAGDGGSADLGPGSYVWTAVASEGYELTGPVAGQVTARDCPPVVLGDPPLTRDDDPASPTLPARLAKTGPGAPAMVAVGMLLAVAGWVCAGAARRLEARADA